MNPIAGRKEAGPAGEAGPAHITGWLVSGLNLLEQGITIFDADLRLVHANRRFLKLYELPDRFGEPGVTFEAINRFLAEKGDFGPGDVDVMVAERVERARAFEDHYLERSRPNGMVLAVEGHALAHGGWVALYTDITSKKRNEALLRERADSLSHSLLERSEQLEAANRELVAANRALEEVGSRLAASESRLRTITHSVPAHIAYIDRNRIYRFSNNRLASALGHDPSWLQGKRIEDVFEPAVLEALMPVVKAALEGAAGTVEFSPLDAQGQRRQFRTALAPDFDARGEVAGAYVLSVDITEEKRAVEMMLVSKRMEAAVALTTGVVHDFSNIMTILMGNLARLADADLPAAERDRILQATRRAVERGSRVTDQLMSFSRNEELSPRPCDVNRITEDLVRLFASSLDPAISLEVKENARAVTAMMDERAYQDALLNLLLNARDAIGHRGSIVVAIGSQTHAGVACASICVRDDGCGFAEGTIERACDAFFSTKQGGRGRGLGLSMVRRFVRRSGGDLLIESRPGEGAAITLFLPLAEPASAMPGHGAAPAGNPFAGSLALVLDDEPQIRELVRGYLLEAGMRVVEAGAAGEALELARNVPDIALVVSDIMLARGESGLDFCRSVRDLRPHLPCLLVSGLETTHPALAAAKAEFALLKKPFGEAELRAALAALPERAA